MTKAWIFDLDGVVTHLTKKKIIHTEILNAFVNILRQHELLTINTGRSLTFIREEVFNPLIGALQQQQLSENLLHNFFAVGEKGNAWIEDGKDCFDMSTPLPKNFTEAVKKLIEKDFSYSMFFDTTKHTMISLEINTQFPLDTYKKVQKKLLPPLDALLSNAKLNTDFLIDPSISAVDIQSQYAGKGKGITRIIDWLTRKHMDPEKFIALGDSLADLAMGYSLQKLKKTFTFVFVGEKNLLENQQITFPIIYTQKHFDEGTVEFLEQQLA